MHSELVELRRELAVLESKSRSQKLSEVDATRLRLVRWLILQVEAGYRPVAVA